MKNINTLQLRQNKPFPKNFLIRLFIVAFVFSLFSFIPTKDSTAQGIWPLETEEAWPIDEGTLQLSFRGEFQDSREVPFAPLMTDGEFTRGIIAATLGIGSRVELDMLYDFVDFDPEIGTGDSGSGDLRIATKIGIIGGPDSDTSLGLRLMTKLPNASEKYGLGTNETDFSFSLLLSNDFEHVLVHLNLGMAILGDPTNNSDQDDVMTYGIAFVIPAGPVEFVAEVSGTTMSQENNERAVARGGIRWNITENIVFDIGGGVGLNNDSEDWSVTSGLTVRTELF
jgi:hypothetical protein